MASSRLRQLPLSLLFVNSFFSLYDTSQFRLIENKLGLDPALRQPHMCKCVFVVFETYIQCSEFASVRIVSAVGSCNHGFRRYNEFLPEEDRAKVEMAEDGHGLTLFRAIETWLDRAPFVNVGEWSFLTECAPSYFLREFVLSFPA